MIFSIPNVLTLQEVDKITKSLAEGEFVDGKLTAGWHAKLVKNNQPLKSQTTLGKQLTEQIKSALHRNSLFQTAVRPRAIHSVLLSRYDVDMAYDRHVDNAVMNNSRMWRTDVSFTLFLSSPKDYEGGELVIESADDEKAYKLESGCALFYPSTSLHRVNPVKKGTRLVAVGWVQSLIRDQGDREILFDLETARRVIFTRDGKTAEFDLISKSIANLIRKWADL